MVVFKIYICLKFVGFNFFDFVNGVIIKDFIGMRIEIILVVLVLVIGKLFFICRKLIL